MSDESPKSPDRRRHHRSISQLIASINMGKSSFNDFLEFSQLQNVFFFLPNFN